MATLDVTAAETVRAPIDRVWEIASGTSRYAEWVEGTLKVTRTDGPAIVHAVLRRRVRDGRGGRAGEARVRH